MMRRHIDICVTLTALAAGLIAQTAPQDESSAPMSQQQQLTGQPGLRRYQEPTHRVPASQYSPLAAQGGYLHAAKSPLDALVHALNPHDVNLGAMWEERRRIWLENAGANKYFWYSFGATGLVILSWFALAWVHTDRVRERWQLAEHAADALRYAEYCKRKAKEAIDRHNAHIETCNRVIEAGESGMTTPETANLEAHKREIEQLNKDKKACESEISRLNDELDQRSAELESLRGRAPAVEQITNPTTTQTESANAVLVNRIQRLEAEIRRLRQSRASAAKVRTEEGGSVQKQS